MPSSLRMLISLERGLLIRYNKTARDCRRDSAKGKTNTSCARACSRIWSGKWYLWHGNVFQALNELQSLEMDLDAAAFENDYRTQLPSIP